jgi:DNA-binding transcriptional ArsR family regulator
MAKDQGKELMDGMLHPVRMRIMIVLSGSEGMTPLQLAEQLDDVPQATLYRHIARMLKVGLLQVIDERPVRGTVEKVYALNRMTATRLGPDAIAHLSKEDHMHYFTAFTVTLLDEFSQYLNHTEKIDLAADGVGYGQNLLFMTDEDLVTFSRAMNEAVVGPYLKASSDPNCKKRIFSTILVPEVSGKDEKK